MQTLVLTHLALTAGLLGLLTLVVVLQVTARVVRRAAVAVRSARATEAAGPALQAQRA